MAAIPMTVAQIAKLEQVSERQVQRYIKEGYQGHILKSVKLGRSYSISELDYRRWRRECGFDPAAVPVLPTTPKLDAVPAKPEPASDANLVSVPVFRPWPLCADPDGELTTGPHEHSRNWPDPRACEAHRVEMLRQQLSRYRGDENAEPEN